MPPQSSDETERPQSSDETERPRAPGDVRAWMRRDLVDAMKARDQQAVEALRSALARIDNAEAVDPGSLDAEALDEGVFDDKVFDDEVVDHQGSDAEVVDHQGSDDEVVDHQGFDAAPAPPAAGSGHPMVAGSIPGVGAAEVARRVLTPEQMAGIVRNEVIEREAAAEILERVGRPDQARRLRAQATLLTTYLSS